MFLVCQRFLLPGTKRFQNQEIKLGKCDGVLVISLPERKREPLLTESVLESICLGSGSPRPFCFVRPPTWDADLLRTETAPDFSLE